MHKWVKRCLIGALVAGIILEGALQVFVKIEERKRAEAPGNSAKYDLVNLEKTEDSPLRDKTILFLGSSVTYGAAAEGQSFVELFELANLIISTIATMKMINSIIHKTLFLFI